ncbi:exported hypothetical protein [Verrucomicrobia bacterium]|nr:exported hypothetical protein [Verrucomicrobiota bacterium]
MNRWKIVPAILGLALLQISCAVRGHVGVEVPLPPPPVVEFVEPEPPFVGGVWVGGRWVWHAERGRYEWHHGHWRQ